MSREIKFRCWNKKSHRFLAWFDLDHFGKVIRSILDTAHICYQDYQKYCVVEQYTGLKDKNGVEIYEGDIVNITAIVETDDSDMACIMDTNSVVCWDKEHARWDVNDKPESKDWDYRRRRYFVFVDSDDRENIEVIGNIHENPELLGGE